MINSYSLTFGFVDDIGDFLFLCFFLKPVILRRIKLLLAKTSHWTKNIVQPADTPSRAAEIKCFKILNISLQFKLCKM